MFSFIVYIYIYIYWNITNIRTFIYVVYNTTTHICAHTIVCVRCANDNNCIVNNRFTSHTHIATSS